MTLNLAKSTDPTYMRIAVSRDIVPRRRAFQNFGFAINDFLRFAVLKLKGKCLEKHLLE